MKLVQFYRGEIPTNDGDFLDDIIFHWKYEQLEGCHSYVQWMFPMKEGSMFHPEVPRLTDEEIAIFKADPYLQSSIDVAFFKMMDFYGFKISRTEVSPLAWQEPGRHKNPKWWLDHFNHNFLRITRILKSTRYLGKEPLAAMLWNVLQSLKEEHLAVISENTFEYWQEAALAPLP